MDFRTSISTARWHATQAMQALDQLDRSQPLSAPTNQRLLDSAVRSISPGATGAGSMALDASRWERWVTVRQIRDVGSALELLDRAWWGLRGRSGAIDVDGARGNLWNAVAMLDRAATGGWGWSPMTNWQHAAA